MKSAGWTREVRWIRVDDSRMQHYDVDTACNMLGIEYDLTNPAVMIDPDGTKESQYLGCVERMALEEGNNCLRV